MTAYYKTSIKDALCQIDQNTVAIFIDCPSMHIVQLQSYFEIFESVGVVRTLDTLSNKVCIITTNDMIPDCVEILDGLSDKIPVSLINKEDKLLDKLEGLKDG